MKDALKEQPVYSEVWWWLVGALGLFCFLWHGKPAVCMLMTNVLIIPPEAGVFFILATGTDSKRVEVVIKVAFVLNF